MFGVQFAIKIILLWLVVNSVLVESVRQKKDVHHMIFLREPIKNRHKHHYHGHSSRSKRNKHKHHHSSEESEESFEKSEEDNSTTTTERPKFKREQHKHRNHHHKSHKKHNKKHQNAINDDKWMPMKSQELFDGKSVVYPGGYHNGAIHFSQPVPIEITTQYPLYPPLDNDFKTKIVRPTLADSPLIGTVDTYKPFDYSILENKPKIVTPLSIIVEEDKGANNNQAPKQQNHQIRGRGASRFRIKQKNQQ